MLQPDYPPAKAGSKTTRPHGSAGIIMNGEVADRNFWPVSGERWFGCGMMQSANLKLPTAEMGFSFPVIGELALVKPTQGGNLPPVGITILDFGFSKLYTLARSIL
jgi:hypothetical protein